MLRPSPNHGTQRLPNDDDDEHVVEWLEKAELVCNLRAIAHLESVTPLRLTSTFRRLSATPWREQTDSRKITKALRTAFAVDSFTAYEQFVGRRLQPRETVVAFLVVLRRLAVPFGRLSDKTPHGVCFCCRTACYREATVESWIADG